MKRIFLFLPISLLLNCSHPGGETVGTINIVSELMQTDHEFSDFSVRNGMKAAFLKYADEEAVILRPNAYPIKGIEAIRETFASRTDTSFILSWKPLKAFHSESGELGYTYGIYTLSVQDSVKYGTYITIWKKNDGYWKFVLDTGNEGLVE